MADNPYRFRNNQHLLEREKYLRVQLDDLRKMLGSERAAADAGLLSSLKELIRLEELVGEFAAELAFCQLEILRRGLEAAP